jgi:hypothetical protein
MHVRYRIGLTQPSTPDLVHRLRNLGEALYGSLGSKAKLDMMEIDAATEHFWVHVSEKRNLGEVADTIRKLVARHGPDDAFVAERVRNESD